MPPAHPPQPRYATHSQNAGNAYELAFIVSVRTRAMPMRSLLVALVLKTRIAYEQWSHRRFLLFRLTPQTKICRYEPKEEVEMQQVLPFMLCRRPSIHEMVNEILPISCLSWCTRAVSGACAVPTSTRPSRGAQHRLIWKAKTAHPKHVAS